MTLLWAWRYRRHWWAAPATLITAYLIEKSGQMFLKAAVHRGHPPTTLGTYPSGGCARAVLIYGLVIFIFLRWGQPTRRWHWLIGAAVLAVCVTTQAYARIYNLEHWFTDVLGGIIYGSLLLVLMITVFEILTRDPQDQPPPRTTQSTADTIRGRRTNTITP